MPSIVKETKDEQGNLHSFNDEPAAVFVNGTKYWYCHGKRHRDNGPAIIYNNGSKHWYCHGKRHREDGPAIIAHDGQKQWYHGKLHREDGPAIVTSDGYKFWYHHGKRHTFHEWAKLLSLTEEQKTELLLSI